MSTFLLGIIFFSSLVGVFFIILKHLPMVSSLRPEALAHIRHDALKGEILLLRFERWCIVPLQELLHNARPWSLAFAKKFYRLLHLLKTLEHYYEKAALREKSTTTNVAVVAETSDGLIAEAKAFAEKELFDDAERKYIAAIALDPKSIVAYEGLGELYFTKKDYDAARATYAHIVKLNERNAAAHARLGAIASASGNLQEAEQDYAKAAELANDLVASHIDLGVVHQTMEKHESALKNFLQARELEPKNPRVLDLLLDTAIIVGKRALAEEALSALAEANPENQKLEELGKRVAEMPAEEVTVKKSRRKKSEGS